MCSPDTSLLLPQAGFLTASSSFSAKDWEPCPLPRVRAPSATPAFDSDPEVSDVDEEGPGGPAGPADTVSPGSRSDAQTLALMLQEQLDAIDEEIRQGPYRVWARASSAASLSPQVQAQHWAQEPGPWGQELLWQMLKGGPRSPSLWLVSRGLWGGSTVRTLERSLGG